MNTFISLLYRVYLFASKIPTAMIFILGFMFGYERHMYVDYSRRTAIAQDTNRMQLSIEYVRHHIVLWCIIFSIWAVSSMLYYHIIKERPKTT